MNQKNKPQPKKFIKKMYSILKDSRYETIVSWDDNGTCILIKNCNKFQSEVIPHNFRLKKMSSFIRQLHLYDFHKVKSNSSVLVFKHQIFQKGNQNSFNNIGRKRLSKTAKALEEQNLPKSMSDEVFDKQDSMKNQKKLQIEQKKSVCQIYNSIFNQFNNSFSNEIISSDNIMHLDF